MSTSTTLELIRQAMERGEQVMVGSAFQNGLDVFSARLNEAGVNVILTAYSWAFDKFEQFINRAHRMNSPWPVNIWSVICAGSIDRKLEAGIHEKKEASELVLDGHLLGENPAEVSLHELLRIAQTEFKNIKTIDEEELEQGWPRLRAALGQAFLKWKSELLDTPKPATNVSPLWRQRFIHG